MFPEFHTSLREELRPAFLEIRDEQLVRVYHPKKFRLYEYAELAELYGEPEDWMYDGRVRRTMFGRDGRMWLLADFKLWWKSDEAEHSGLLFTADPRTGMEWLRGLIADRTHRDGHCLREFSQEAMRLQPRFRPHFRLIERASQRLVDGGDKLKELGDEDLLRQLGVGNSAGAP